MKKLAIVTTHPIQYYAPLFKLLSQRGFIKIKVFYTWSQSYKGLQYDPGFGKKIEWDIPLLDGYEYQFVNNIAQKPGSDHFKGIVNPTLNSEIEEWQSDAILLIGWSFKSHLKTMRYFHNKQPVFFRGDSTLLAERWGFKLIIRTFFLRWVYSHIDIAFYVGTNNKKYFSRHGLKSSQLTFAPHAVDNVRFFDDNDTFNNEALLWRKSFGIKTNDIVFLYAGKLEYKKDPELLIKAYKKIKSSEIHLIILGNGPLEKKLKSKYTGDLNLHFIDFQNQSKMPVVYRLGDILVLPSKGPVETWGLCVNEAMACSRAVIVSDRCGCGVDLVKNNINGFIFRRDNLSDLAKNMNDVIAQKHRLKEMGENSREIIKSWSFEKICEQIEKVTVKQTSGLNKKI